MTVNMVMEHYTYQMENILKVSSIRIYWKVRVNSIKPMG